MKTCITLSLVLFIGVLSSCQKEQVAPNPANAPARTTVEAQARLMARTRWVIDEALSDGQSIYKRRQGSLNDADLELEWCRFGQNGVFEVKMVGNPATDNLYYKTDEPTNQLVISENAAFTNPSTWTTVKTGSVYADGFTMEMKDGTDRLTLKMVSMP